MAVMVTIGGNRNPRLTGAQTLALRAGGLQRTCEVGGSLVLLISKSRILRIFQIAGLTLARAPDTRRSLFAVAVSFFVSCHICAAPPLGGSAASARSESVRAVTVSANDGQVLVECR